MIAERLIRSVTAVSAVLVVLAAVGSQPSAAASTATIGDATSASGISVLAASTAADTRDALADCSDLIPTYGTPRDAANPGQGSIRIDQCEAAAEPGQYLTVIGTGFAERPGGSLSYKLLDGDPDHQFTDPQDAGVVAAGGTVTVSDAASLPDGNGEFRVRLRLPDDAIPGDVYWVRLLGGNDGTAAGSVSKYAKFRVADAQSNGPGKPVVRLDDRRGDITAGESFTVNGSGFTEAAESTDPADRAIHAQLVPADGSSEGIALEPGTPDSAIRDDGTFSTALTVPGSLPAGEYTLVVSAGGRSADGITVVVRAPAAPTFTTSLVSQPVALGDTVTLTAAVDGAPTPEIRWERSDDHGATWTTVRDPYTATGTVTYSPGGLTEALTGAIFRVTATNSQGTVSNIAQVTQRQATDGSTGGGNDSAQVRPEGWNCTSRSVEGDARLCLVETVAEQGKLHLEGIGWTTTSGDRGSCIAVKFDSGDVNAAQPATTDPTGTCQAGGTAANIFAYVLAADDGTWIADIPIPTASNSTTLAERGTEWRDGERHSITLLTGSSRNGDAQRGPTYEFAIGVALDQSTAALTTGDDQLLGETPVTTSGNAPATSAGLLGGLGTTAVDAGQRPLITPATPVRSADDLTELNAGDLEATQDGTVLTVRFPSLDPGAWVYLHAWPGPQAVDWIQLDADRTVRFDIASLEPGDHRFSFVDTQGALAGWVSGTLDGDSGRKSFTPTAIAGSAPSGSDDASSGWNGPLLVGAFGTLLAGLIATTTLGLLRGGRKS